MDAEMVSRFHRHGSTFVGAILMSNRTTKHESLQRKLFGMTSTWAWHIMQIKAGMLLFLFEHEERKLYGVFEAASDGAMNIVPNAFLSSGNSFPAQVMFKRMWMCKPLSEDEFSDAIKHNYVAQKRFKFGLSYRQVYNLIQLFSLKRINVKQYQRPAIPNEIIEEFERYDRNRVRVIGGGGSQKIFSDEDSVDDDIGSQRYLGSSRPILNRILSVNSKRQLDHRVSPSVEARPPCHLSYQFMPPHLVPSTSPSDLSISGNTSKCPEYGYHALGTHYSTLPQKPIACLGSSRDAQPHRFNAQSHASNICARSLHLGHPNLVGSSIPACDPCNASLFPESHTTPKISSSWGMPKTEGTDSFPSAHTINFHRRPEASTYRCDFEEQRCVALGALHDYIPLVGTDCVDMDFISSYLDTSGNYSSESMEDDDLQGMQPCLAKYSEVGYPTCDSRLHSDTEQGRISVFSRLSNARKACRVRKSQEAIHKCIAQTTQNRFSLDHPARVLSQKKEQLSKERAVICDDVEKFECEVVMEPSMTGENHMNAGAESGLDEDTSQEYKRRKVLLASASEEEPGNVQGSLPEMVEAKSIIENNTMNIKTREIASPNNFDNENKNASDSEAISDKREISTRSSNNRRKEVSNRNLRWFLQKSINTLSKESNMDHVNGRAEETNGITGD